MKTCRTCKRVLSLDNYHPQPLSPDKHGIDCKECVSAKSKDYALKKKLEGEVGDREALGSRQKGCSVSIWPRYLRETPRTPSPAATAVGRLPISTTLLPISKPSKTVFGFVRAATGEHQGVLNSEN